MPLWMMRMTMLVAIGPARRRDIYRQLPATLAEHEVVRALDGSWENYRDVAAAVLLMVGGASRLPWVPAAVERLTAVLPSVRVHTFPRLDHFGPDQKGPREVAEEIRRHFA